MSDFSPFPKAANLQPLMELFEQHREQVLADYFTFLRFQSVSSEPSYHDDVLNCCDWVERYLLQAGFSVERWSGKGYPTVFASWCSAGGDAPTVLLYGHYDVQPVDPLELWTTPPFEPHVRDGEVYARGAMDDKGQCFFVMAALASLLKRDGALPLNVKIVIEGEEETGSTTLFELVQSKKEQLRADSLVVVDVGCGSPEAPAVTLGVRGMNSFELVLTGSSTDLHSGSNGGIVYNPNRALVEILAALHDSSGRVTVPGFYDEVIELSPSERSQISFSFDPLLYEKQFAATPNGGEQNFSAPERAWIRPTLEINGIAGGYHGPGFKTVIPAKAIAKISCRLVPNQDPQKILEEVTNHVRNLVPAGIRADIHSFGGGLPVRSSPDSEVVRAAAQAYSEIFGKECRFVLEGGSIPVTSQLAAASGAEIVFLGFGMPDDNMHAPNEHFGLARLKVGFVMIGRLLELLAKK